MEWLLPFLVLSRSSGLRDGALADQLLPHLLPGGPAERIAFAALGAERQASAERRMLAEAIKAGHFKHASDLDAYPALKRAFDRLPADVQSSLFPKSSSGASKPPPSTTKSSSSTSSSAGTTTSTPGATAA